MAIYNKDNQTPITGVYSTDENGVPTTIEKVYFEDKLVWPESSAPLTIGDGSGLIEVSWNIDISNNMIMSLMESEYIYIKDKPIFSAFLQKFTISGGKPPYTIDWNYVGSVPRFPANFSGLRLPLDEVFTNNIDYTTAVTNIEIYGSTWTVMQHSNSNLNLYFISLSGREHGNFNFQNKARGWNITITDADGTTVSTVVRHNAAKVWKLRERKTDPWDYYCIQPSPIVGNYETWANCFQYPKTDKNETLGANYYQFNRKTPRSQYTAPYPTVDLTSFTANSDIASWSSAEDPTQSGNINYAGIIGYNNSSSHKWQLPVKELPGDIHGTEYPPEFEDIKAFPSIESNNATRFYVVGPTDKVQAITDLFANLYGCIIFPSYNIGGFDELDVHLGMIWKGADDSENASGTYLLVNGNYLTGVQGASYWAPLMLIKPATVIKLVVTKRPGEEKGFEARWYTNRALTNKYDFLPTDLDTGYYFYLLNSNKEYKAYIGLNLRSVIGTTSTLPSTDPDNPSLLYEYSTGNIVLEDGDFLVCVSNPNSMDLAGNANTKQIIFENSDPYSENHPIDLWFEDENGNRVESITLPIGTDSSYDLNLNLKWTGGANRGATLEETNYMYWSEGPITNGKWLTLNTDVNISNYDAEFYMRYHHNEDVNVKALITIINPSNYIVPTFVATRDNEISICGIRESDSVVRWTFKVFPDPNSAVRHWKGVTHLFDRWWIIVGDNYYFIYTSDDNSATTHHDFIDGVTYDAYGVEFNGNRIIVTVLGGVLLSDDLSNVDLQFHLITWRFVAIASLTVMGQANVIKYLKDGRWLISDGIGVDDSDTTSGYPDSKIFYSVDDGETWTDISSKLYVNSVPHWAYDPINDHLYSIDQRIGGTPMFTKWTSSDSSALATTFDTGIDAGDHTLITGSKCGNRVWYYEGKILIWFPAATSANFIPGTVPVTQSTGWPTEASNPGNSNSLFTVYDRGFRAACYFDGNKIYLAMGISTWSTFIAYKGVVVGTIESNNSVTFSIKDNQDHELDADGNSVWGKRIYNIAAKKSEIPIPPEATTEYPVAFFMSGSGEHVREGNLYAIMDWDTDANNVLQHVKPREFQTGQFINMGNYEIITADRNKGKIYKSTDYGYNFVKKYTMPNPSASEYIYGIKSAKLYPATQSTSTMYVMPAKYGYRTPNPGVKLLIWYDDGERWITPMDLPTTPAYSFGLEFRNIVDIFDNHETWPQIIMYLGSPSKFYTYIADNAGGWIDVTPSNMMLYHNISKTHTGFIALGANRIRYYSIDANGDWSWSAEEKDIVPGVSVLFDWTSWFYSSVTKKEYLFGNDNNYCYMAFRTFGQGDPWTIVNLGIDVDGDFNGGTLVVQSNHVYNQGFAVIMIDPLNLGLSPIGLYFNNVGTYKIIRPPNIYTMDWNDIILTPVPS